MQADDRHRSEAQRGTAAALLSRALTDWQYRRDLARQLRQIDQTERQQLKELSRLLRRRRDLERQIATLRSAHQLMSAWHTVHVPLGVTLFLSAFLHVIGTLYYGAVKLIQ
jgi:cell division protein FtsB